MTTPKIAVYSLPDLKNTTDDALPNYLTSLKFKQSHLLTDVRLALGYSAVAIAAVLFYFDYQLGWDDTKAYTLWAVIVYFTLNSALTIWIWAVEKGKIFVGELNGTLLSVASSVTKHTPIYKVTVRYSEPSGSNTYDWETLEFSAPFTKWFTADGHFVAKPFQQWLASNVPVVGKADPQSVVEAEKLPAESVVKPKEVINPVGKMWLDPSLVTTSSAPTSMSEAVAAGARSRKSKK